MKKPAYVPAPPKEAEKQLSKKERKKKELAELEALLADFGVAPKESDSQDESRGNCEQFFQINSAIMIRDCCSSVFSLLVPFALFYFSASEILCKERIKAESYSFPSCLS